MANEKQTRFWLMHFWLEWKEIRDRQSHKESAKEKPMPKPKAKERRWLFAVFGSPLCWPRYLTVPSNTQHAKKWGGFYEVAVLKNRFHSVWRSVAPSSSLLQHWHPFEGNTPEESLTQPVLPFSPNSSASFFVSRILNSCSLAPCSSSFPNERQCSEIAR